MKTLEEWRTDIENTQLELSAYRMIVEGFDILVRLPETDPTDRSKFATNSRYY